MLQLPWLDERNPSETFPPVELALAEPNGLLCAGGCLSPERLLKAYRQGIFPWYSDDEPILWWSPSPRMVLIPDQLKISRSLKKNLRNKAWRVTANKDFCNVMQACAEARAGQEGTWITAEMLAAYTELHECGHAHSIEVWQHNQLVGGLYGLLIGKVFFGESMFSRVSDASKVGFFALCRHLTGTGVALIDCQVYSDHLASLGAIEISRSDFLARLTILTSHASQNQWPRSLYHNQPAPDKASR